MCRLLRTSTCNLLCKGCSLQKLARLANPLMAGSVNISLFRISIQIYPYWQAQRS